jgi:hypothetical protein
VPSIFGGNDGLNFDPEVRRQWRLLVRRARQERLAREALERGEDPPPAPEGLIAPGDPTEAQFLAQAERDWAAFWGPQGPPTGDRTPPGSLPPSPSFPEEEGPQGPRGLGSPSPTPGTPEDSTAESPPGPGTRGDGGDRGAGSGSAPSSSPPSSRRPSPTPPSRST